MNKAPSDRTRVRTQKQRGIYDWDTIRAILDESPICHVGIADQAQPFVIPMACARDGDDLLLHGHAKSRLIQHLGEGQPACVTITLLDGLVLAKSQFHHSINYRSAVLFGTASRIEEPEEKQRALLKLVAHLSPGREKLARPGNATELKATTILRFKIDEASAKVRTGPPVDDPEDADLDVWIGVIPIYQIEGPPLQADSPYL